MGIGFFALFLNKLPKELPQLLCSQFVVVLVQSHILMNLHWGIVNNDQIVVGCFLAAYIQHPLLSGRDLLVKTSEDKKFLDEFNNQWKTLWRDLVGDRIHAEKIASRDYSLLFIERGTVVKATREVKPLTYRETLKQNRQTSNLKTLPPDPNSGGWRKFSQTAIKAQKKPETQKEAQPKLKDKPPQQPKKGGRGWLHAKTYPR